jgi:hypothetical protein
MRGKPLFKQLRMIIRIKIFIALLLVFLLAGCASAPLRLNEPITLMSGETKQVGPDGFEITLRSVSEDSGCYSPSDCSTMIFHGSIAVRLGEKKDLMQIGAVMKAGQVVPLDIDGYQFQLTGLKPEGQKLEATFIILGPKKGTSATP